MVRELTGKMPFVFHPDDMPQGLQLKKNTIDVWFMSLDIDESCLESFLGILSEEEHVKARRMRIEKYRKHYVAARGLLRQIIAKYMNEAPERLEFQYGQDGKPALAEAFSSTGLTFNLSHSHGLALVCIACERAIGVDIEKIRHDKSVTEIAKRFFSNREYEALIRLPAEQRKQGFYKCWTRKEAYLKATGTGLVFPLDRFDVSLTPGEPAALLGHRTDPEQVSMWSIVDLDAGPDYAAALAVAGKDFTVKRQSGVRNQV